MNLNILKFKYTQLKVTVILYYDFYLNKIFLLFLAALSSSRSPIVRWSIVASGL